VPKSVTLNDLERRNGRYLRYLTEIGSFVARAWLKLNSYCLQENCNPKICFRQHMIHSDILRDTEEECVKERHPHSKAKTSNKNELSFI